MLPLIFGSSNIPDKNSKIGRKFYYLEKLNSKIGRKTYYLEKWNSKNGRKFYYHYVLRALKTSRSCSRWQPMFLRPKCHKESKNGFKTISFRRYPTMFFSKNCFRHQKLSKKFPLWDCSSLDIRVWMALEVLFRTVWT